MFLGTESVGVGLAGLSFDDTLDESRLDESSLSMLSALISDAVESGLVVCFAGSSAPNN